MISRRKFLKGSMATLVLVPLAACSSDDNGPVSAGGGSSCSGVSTIGSASAGHVHTMCVPSGDLTSPPANGATYTTTNDSGHVHSVTLTQAQLQTVAGGGMVDITSSSTGHTHSFIIKMA